MDKTNRAFPTRLRQARTGFYPDGLKVHRVSQDSTRTRAGDHDGLPPTVLIVEDFEDTRLLMRLELERRGFRVIEATNGEEGVECARRERPEIILMDVGLPVMDGIAATRQIRQDDEMRDALIVALTAHHEAEYRTHALAAGCDAYLTKPIDFDWLNDLLSRLLP